jgi:hypothetical protein
MTDAFVKFYYGTALIVCASIMADMAVVEYRGLVLSPVVMCLVLLSLASILVGDLIVQNALNRSSIE